VKKLNRGQRVKLSERGLKYHKSRKPISLRGEIIDWSKRTGTITRVAATGGGIAVLWDGNKYQSDEVSPAFLEGVE
jgi:hypothetical protein